MSRAPAAALRHTPGAPLAATLALAAALSAVGLIAPRPAAGHGLVQRGNLPIPEWLFAWVATAVLVVSFLGLAAAWPRPKLERVPWRPLPEALGRLLTSRPVTVSAGAVGAALLVLVIVAGYQGPPTPNGNLAPTFILILFWVGMAFASVLLGDVFHALNPWRALGRFGGWAARGLSGGRTRSARPYPTRLGHWPAALGLLAFSWIELASGWGEHPARLVTAAVVYSGVTLAGVAVYGVEPWIRRAEAFSVYFGLLARMAVFEVRDRRLGVRPPVAGLAALEPVAGTVAVVTTMIGTVSFDGLSQGPAWRAVAVLLNDRFLSLGLSIETAVRLSSTLGLLACVALVAAFYRLGVAGAHSAGRRWSTDHLSAAFAPALVPIAMAYVAAHYLTFLLLEGQAIGYLASDPLGRGWDLFGTRTAGIDFGLISQTTAWYAQVAFIVLGHVAGLALAHERALTLFGAAREAVRSQYWMLAVMVGFTTLALWLLAQTAA